MTILRSLPGVGRIVLATLLAEATDALRRRDYHALRCLSGVAPVTKRSGKSKIAFMRQAAHLRLRNAVYHSRGTGQPHQPITPERLGHPKTNSSPWKATNFRRATETHRSSRVSARVAITVTISWGGLLTEIHGKIFVDEGRRLERRTARKPNEVGAAETIETFAVAQQLHCRKHLITGNNDDAAVNGCDGWGTPAGFCLMFDCQKSRNSSDFHDLSAPRQPGRRSDQCLRNSSLIVSCDLHRQTESQTG